MKAISHPDRPRVSRRDVPRVFLIYALLLGGSLIFIWPFLWMAATSAKVDRELFSDTLRLLPQRPIPRGRSPYVDERLFANLHGPRLAEALGIISANLHGLRYPWPGDLDRDTLITQTARGIYARLLNVLPDNIWKESSAQLRAELASRVTPPLIADVVSELRRYLALGSLRALSYDQQEDVLVPDSRVASSWQIGGNAHARLRQVISPRESGGELDYDFRTGNTMTLTQTFQTTFPLSRLHRLQLGLHNDDTWHALRIEVEKDGKRYRAERAVPLGDSDWVIGSWQEPGPDDRPTKTKTWTWLVATSKPAPMGRQNELRVTIEITRSSQLQAWWFKVTHNYRLFFDQIPFWRYVGTSIFLVLLNLIGTLLSCSLVAYSFARLQWPGRNLCFALLLATMMIPAQVTMIPQFLIMQRLGWYNTLQPLWIGSFVAPAFYVFLLRQFLKGIPRDLEDAARLDGCGFFRIYWHIMLPLVRPTLAVIAIFTFLATWNEFMLSLIYLSDQRLYPLSFGLYAFQVIVSNPGTAKGMGMVMAGSLLMMLPVIAIFFFAQRYFLRGVTLTGMKG